MKLDTSKMTREEIEIIRDFYFLHTFRKVAEKRKLPYETVRNFIKTLRFEDKKSILPTKANEKEEILSEKSKRKEAKEKHYQEILQDYIQLGTLQKVADKRGVSRNAIQQVIKRIGYKKPKKDKLLIKANAKGERLAKKANKFWNNAKKLDNGCLEWRGAKFKTGYGHVNLMGIGGGYAHRIAWILINGQIPDGMFVCHKCDNPSCINPEHLFLGTPKDNVQDSISKGRFKPWGRSGRYGR